MSTASGLDPEFRPVQEHAEFTPADALFRERTCRRSILVLFVASVPAVLLP